MSRESQSDTGRKGAATQTKITQGYQMPPNRSKGEFKTAYSGGRGTRDDEGCPCDEVGAVPSDRD